MNEPELFYLSKEDELSLQEEAYLLLDNFIKFNFSRTQMEPILLISTSA